MSEPFESVGVIGAGAWGTALAQTAARAGRRVVLWSRRKEHAVGLSARRENADYLPGVELDAKVKPVHDLAETLACDVILSVAPAQYTRAILAAAAAYARPGQPIVCCSKGLEQSSRKFMAAVTAETLPDARIAVLSGPGFAAEVANDLPAAVTLACADPALAQRLAATIARPTFRPYASDDVIGAEVGGVVKNVLAIACGIVEGRRLGRSAHASLVTRGFAEMTRLGVALGARHETLQGPCGLGDLVLTCSSAQSRNMSLGLKLGQGQRLKDILDDRRGVTEGVATAPALVELARERGVEMPICEAVLDVLTGRVSIDRAIAALLSRPLRGQND